MKFVLAVGADQTLLKEGVNHRSVSSIVTEIGIPGWINREAER